MMDQNDLLKQDAPFLNRFEKHTFSYEKLLSEDDLQLAQEIINDFKIIIRIGHFKCMYL